MQVLFVAKDDSLAEYLRGQGHRTKTVYTNDIALRAAQEFGAEAVVYCTNALKLEGHDKVVQELQNAGFRVILAAEKGDPVVQFAAALGVTDLLTFPVDPAAVLHRLENPATREEAAALVRRLAQPEKEKPEAPKKSPGLSLKLPKLPGLKRQKEKERTVEEAPDKEEQREAPRGQKETPAAPAPLPASGAPPEEPEPAPARPGPLPEPPKPAPVAWNAGEAGRERREAPLGPGAGEAALPESDDVYRDALTGCYTRRYLLERFNLSGPCAVVFIDLDNFKPVNDLLGHEAGDRVLAAFGKMLNEQLKGRDLAVRWGGDEFALVLPETSPKAAEKVVENLRRAWEKCAPDTGNLKVGFSAGTAAGRGKGGLAEAIKAADKAMYTQKNQAKAAVPPWLPARGGPVVSYPYAPPEAAKTESFSFWGAVETLWAVTSAAVEYVTVAALLSLLVWLVDFAVCFAGGHPPSVLHQAAQAVERFWWFVWDLLKGLSF